LIASLASWDLQQTRTHRKRPPGLGRCLQSRPTRSDRLDPPRAPGGRSSGDVAYGQHEELDRLVEFDQCQQAVVLSTAGGADRQMHADAVEPCAGVPAAELCFDVAVEHRAAGSAAGVAVIDLEDRFEEEAIAR
jgi:hypothetical protein